MIFRMQTAMRFLALGIVAFLAAAPLPQTGPLDYGPWNRDQEWFESSDGLTFVKKGIFVERAGVPSLARGADGRLFAVFQWFPLSDREAFDQVALMCSSDAGRTWSRPETIRVAGQPANLYRVFDPTLVVLPEGSFRLYYSAERTSAQVPRGNRAIFSAISDDALNYRFEPGQRFGFEDTETYDCAVAGLGGYWHLFCPVSGASGWGYHALSADGLQFAPQPRVFMPSGREWLGNALTSGIALTFFGSGGPGGAWAGTSPDGYTWTLAPSATGLGGDPAVVPLGDGRFLGIATGPLRADAKTGPPVFTKSAIVRR